MKSPHKRTVSTILLLCALAQAGAPVLAQSTASVTITALDRGSLRPFDKLVITGSGFLPATAAISVLFVPRQHGVPVAVPVFSSTATRLEVIVPAFLDPVTGDFGFGQADVQVVQVTRDAVMSSNVLTGLDVAPVPMLPESVRAGKVTQALMRLSLESITAAGAGAGDAGPALIAFKEAQSALLTQLDAVVANPNAAAAAITTDASVFSIDGKMLAASDRLIAAYLTSLGPLVSGQRYGASGTLRDPSCTYDTGFSDLDEKLCEVRTGVLAVSRSWITGTAVVGAGLVGIIVIAATGATFAGLAAGAAGVAVLAGAAQLAYLGVSGTLAPSLLSADAPPLMDMLRDHGRKVWETYSEYGVPVTTAAMTGADAVSKFAGRITRAGLDPKGGTTLAALRMDPIGTLREMVAFQGSGEATVPTPIAVPSTQATRTFFEVRVGPPQLSWFDGAYLGSISVNVLHSRGRDFGILDLSFTVLNGTVKLIDPGAGAGSVSAIGRFTSSVGSCTLSGTLEARSPTGPSVGGGALAVCVNGEYTGWGTWTATRAPKP